LLEGSDSSRGDSGVEQLLSSNEVSATTSPTSLASGNTSTGGQVGAAGGGTGVSGWAWALGSALFPAHFGDLELLLQFRLSGSFTEI